LSKRSRSNNSSSDRNHVKNDDEEAKLGRVGKNGAKICGIRLEEIKEEPLIGHANSNSVNRSLFDAR
jgi:hypothetical protein